MNGFALQGLIDLGVTNPKNIGHQKGQIRPSKVLGQVDVFHALMRKFSMLDCFLLSGLSPIDLAIFERALRLLSAGVDPNNLKEVAEYKRIQRMTLEEIDRGVENWEVVPRLEFLEASLTDED